MADGFDKIPNKIMMALMTYDFTATQLRIVLYVIHKTYGWNKTKDLISIKRMARELGKPRQLISRTVRDLRKLNVVEAEEIRNGKPSYMWITEPENWDKPATCGFHATRGFHATEELHQPATDRFQVPATSGLHQPATDRLHTRDNIRDSIRDNLEKGALPSRWWDEDDSADTMFDGKITVAEFKALSKEEQDAMYEAEGWRL